MKCACSHSPMKHKKGSGPCFVKGCTCSQVLIPESAPAPMLEERTRPTIAEIQALLERDDLEVAILPNGEVTAVTRKHPKVLTMREDLGGEYGFA